MTDRAAIPLHPVAREIAESQGGLKSYPPVERWDNWEEYDPVAWPQKVKRRYSLIPTICFNCEAGCGLLAYVDRETLAIQKFEGNPAHPGSRGRNCAKGPATLNQVTDPERIRYPLRRVGPRGGGRWERVTWDEVLDDIGGRIRKALVEGRQREVMYHLGRPGHELVYLQRVFHAWGIDGHNSHTNVCSASARAGYAFWHGMDRPSPDHANARFILLPVLAPGDRPLLQPARPANHGSQVARRQDRGVRHATQQHRVDGRLVGGAVAGLGVRRAPGDGAYPRAREALRPRVRPPLGELGRVPARGAPRSAGHVRLVRARDRRALRGASPRSTPKPRAASRPRRSSRSRARSAAPARRWRPTSGAIPPPATSAAGRSRARSS